ncbi:MAG TPA: YwqG family protein, partial [Ktedonobacterales bacterium]|nr:YwqG family protein [Ktedonobacterales bacterium]
PAGQALPVNGWLFFFYDGRQQAFGDKPGDRGAWQVLYQPAGALALARQAAPPGLPNESRYKPCSVAYAAEVTLPQRPLLFAPKLGWTADEQHRYEDFIDARVADRSTPRHRLLGHADVIQDDMHLQCQLLSHGIQDDQDPRAATLAAGALNWQLLLQVDSDDSAAMQWGSAGRLYFWIEREALQARRFDNVWMVMQSD